MLLGRGATAAFFAALGALAAAALQPAPRGLPAPLPAALAASFARPTFVPNPSGNPSSAAKVALGLRLFHERELSATGTIACASCHDPKLAFGDGERTGRGITGRPLRRHTPSLWNVAFSPLLFWDGRASSLEEQVRSPIEHPDEMGSTLAAAADRLRRRPDYVRDFRLAFPQDPQPSPQGIARALAAYERTLVSPPTRFDAFIAGQATLSASERDGLAIFLGKGRCGGCHSGVNFTDYNFYDIGLPGDDRGRGAVLGLSAADHAFKTPSLRELAWTAPYMHDGSLATLDDVVRHYERGSVRRPTLSGDLPQGLVLSDAERSDLTAFLETLSSEEPPQPSTESFVNAPLSPQLAPAAMTTSVSQVGKAFSPAHIRLQAGDTLTVLNDDTRTHNVRIYDPRLDFNSGAQEPGQSLSIRFPQPGSFEAFCGIHPSMRLRIDVAR
jgi:cytochrome c peroxidase